MNCYGKSFGHRVECTECKLRKYCGQAGDPPLLVDRAPPPEVNDRLLESGLRNHREQLDEPLRKQYYSREELIELIGFMVSLDYRTLELLEIKLAEPTLNFSDIAAKRGVSRQALHRMVKMRLCRIPELKTVFEFHQRRNHIDKTTTFMEEVCLIRKRVREKQSKQPKPALSFLRNWKSSNRSLLSSPMSIIRGSAIWNSASSVSKPSDRLR